jgi:hypothetical protein
MKRATFRACGFLSVALFLPVVGRAAGPVAEKQPTAAQVKAFSQVRAVQFVNEVPVWKWKGPDRETGLVTNRVRLLLEAAGYTVVDGTRQKADAKVTVWATGEAKPYSYVPAGGGEATDFYTGASVSGTISFEVPGTAPFRVAFAGKWLPPERIEMPNQAPLLPGRGLDQPGDAPYSGAFTTSDLLPCAVSLILAVRRPEAEAGEILRLLVARDFKGCAAKGDLAVPPLIVWLKDPSDGWLAAHALLTIDDPRVVPAVAAWLKGGGLATDPDLLRAFMAKAGPDSFEVLQALIKNDRGVGGGGRSAVITVLGETGDARAIELLLGLSDDGDWMVEANALEALSHFQNDERVVRRLVRALGTCPSPSSGTARIAALSKAARSEKRSRAA